MKREEILQALEEISDARIEKAAQPPKKKVKKLYWYSGIAALLAVAILLGLMLPGGKTIIAPGIIRAEAKAVVTPEYPQKGGGKQDVSNSVTALNTYFSRTIAQFLQDDQDNENLAFSPINLYMSLAILAETTDTETRAEILSLLGAKNMDNLRAQAYWLWIAGYDHWVSCTLANSVWMQKGTSYNDKTMQTLAEYYFASVYENDFALPDAGQPIAQWIDKETGGMLKEQTAALKFDPQTVMALVSTVYLQADWQDTFREKFNTKEVFHGTNGPQECTFMHQGSSKYYYWGEDYSAVSLRLEGGYQMLAILPDEGKTPDDLLQSGCYSEMLLSDKENRKNVIVNLSMPKFDITCKQDMIAGLQDLGIKKVFQMGQADFTPAFPDNKVCVNKVEQSTRVAVDEMGVTAASVVFSIAAGGYPPDETVDFVLDRPFLFIITNGNNIPFFAGVVNNP